MSVYRSPYEAYPFLADPADDLRCDFEILTDRIASSIGLVASLVEEYCAELLQVEELVYHMNPTLRTRFTVAEAEIFWMKDCVDRLTEETKGLCERFVLPCGTTRAAVCHVLRTDTKALVRMLYRYAHSGGEVPNGLFDLANLLSGYFFLLALRLNALDGFREVPFESRNYR